MEEKGLMVMLAPDNALRENLEVIGKVSALLVHNQQLLLYLKREVKKKSIIF